MSSQFFEYGKITILINDNTQVALEICVPISLLFSISPILLKFGKIDDYVLNNPLSAWIPYLTKDRIRSDILQTTPNIEQDINKLKNTKINEILKLFQELSSMIIDYSDLIPMLPLGTYIVFKYRCEIEKLQLIDLELNENSIGVFEFKQALYKIYQEIN